MNEISQSTKITTTQINSLITEVNGKLDLSGGTLSDKITYSCQRIADTNHNSGLYIVSQSDLESNQTSSLALFPITHSSSARQGAFELRAGDGTSTKVLAGHYINGLSWNGNFNMTAGNLSISHNTNSPNVRISNTSGGDCYLLLDRATRANWKFLNQGGYLKFQCDYTDAKQTEYFDCFTMNWNTGNTTFKGTVKAEQYLFNNGSKLWIE